MELLTHLYSLRPTWLPASLLSNRQRRKAE